MATGENLVREKTLVAAKKEWLGGIQATTIVFMVCSPYRMNIYVVPGTVFGSRSGCLAVVLEGVKALGTTGQCEELTHAGMKKCE